MMMPTAAATAMIRRSRMTDTATTERISAIIKPMCKRRNGEKDKKEALNGEVWIEVDGTAKGVQ